MTSPPNPPLILDGVRHAEHPAVRAGVVILAPMFRMAANPDTRVGEWGRPQNEVAPLAVQIGRIWRNLPPENRILNVFAGLSRCCDRGYGSLAGNEWKPSREDILSALLNRTAFPVDQSIALLSPLAKRLRALGHDRPTLWFDAETYPTADDESGSNSDVIQQWCLATRQPPRDIAAVSRECLYKSACIMADAVGWARSTILVAECHTPQCTRGKHYWGPGEIPGGQPGAYTHIACSSWAGGGGGNQPITPEQFADEYRLAQEKQAAGVLVWADGVDAQTLTDQLAAALEAGGN